MPSKSDPASQAVLQVIEEHLDAQGLTGEERGRTGVVLLALAAKIQRAIQASAARAPTLDSNRYREWFKERWGESAPEGAPPQYTESNLQEAFDAGRGAVAAALNQQLEQARQPLNDKPNNQRVRQQVDAACQPILQIARDAGLPLFAGPSGEWVDELRLWVGASK